MKIYKKPMWALLALALTALAPAFAEDEAAKTLPDGWVQVAPDGAGFSVAMPAQPEKKDEGGNPFWSVTVAPNVYAVAINHPPEDIAGKLDNDTDAVLLQNAKETAAGLGTLTSSEKITLGDHTGRESIITGGGPQKDRTVRFQQFWVGGQLLTVRVLTNKELNADADAFFDSFAIVEEEG